MMSVGHVAKLESKEVTNLRRHTGPCKQGAVTISPRFLPAASTWPTLLAHPLLPDA